MLQFKDSEIFKNISFLEENDAKSICGLVNYLQSIKIDKLLQTPKQAYFSRSYSFVNLILYYFLGVENTHQYNISVWSKFIENGKDLLYRFASNPSINWRKVLYSLSKDLIKSIDGDLYDNKNPTCFIIDDTDIEKSGRRIEFIGRVWSHVVNKYILGFKSLNLCYWNGATLFALDFSLHREMGKNKSKPQGLKKKQIKDRYSKKRQEKSFGKKRVEELDESKIDMAINMLKTAIKNKITARYVLIDSWFCCDKLIKYVSSVLSMDLICRAKMGKAKYCYKGKMLSAKELLKKFQYRQDVRRYSRKLKTNYILLKVDFKGTPVKLLLIQTGKNKWILLLTTDRKASAIKIIETYQIRWSIEIFFKECKQFLGLGKCHANDFDSQISNTTFTFIRYNWLSAVKSKSENFGIGTLFRAITQSLYNPTIADKLINLFYKLQTIITDLFQIDVELILSKIMNDDQISDVDRNILNYFCSLETCET